MHLRRGCFLPLTLLLISGCEERLPHLREQYPLADVPGETPMLSQSERCVLSTTKPLPLTGDSIGPLPLTVSLTRLLDLCPTAKDTVYYEHEAVFPALHLQIGSLEILAVQVRMDEEAFAPLPLVMDSAPDLWVISGSGAVLPGAIPIDATVAAVSSVHGEPSWFIENELHVNWASLPDFGFEMVYDYADLVRIQSDPSLVGAARIARVLIRS